jgi:hypothetical protein
LATCSTVTGNECADLLIDPRHCGDCDNVCATAFGRRSDICAGGRCICSAGSYTALLCKDGEVCTSVGCVAEDFAWQSAAAWSACSAPCNGGTQTRAVWCASIDGKVVPDSYCATSGSRPAEERACNTDACDWSIGTWSACSNDCGTGRQTRTVLCATPGGSPAADTFCDGDKPAESQACSSYAGCSYAWVVGTWSVCSNDCGTGAQTRSVTCQREGGITVADSYCSTDKLPTSQTCTSYAGCTYRWVSGAWSTCTLGCAGGSQSHTVVCQREDGVTVNDSYCTTSKPATTQACDPLLAPRRCTSATYEFARWSATNDAAARVACAAACAAGRSTNPFCCEIHYSDFGETQWGTPWACQVYESATLFTPAPDGLSWSAVIGTCQ